jgi:hypothetical protein
MSSTMELNMSKANQIKKPLKVWWIPQIPMQPFYVPVNSIEEAILILDTLAIYDIFQLENKIKPDYANTGGLMCFEDGEWVEWHDEESDDDIRDYCENNRLGRAKDISKAQRK